MVCANAAKLHRKSGGAQPRDLQFSFAPQPESANSHSSLRNWQGKNLLTLLEARIYELSARVTPSLVHYGNQ